MSAQRIRIKLRSYDHRLLDQSAKRIVEVAKRTGAKVAGPIPLATDRSLYCVTFSFAVKFSHITSVYPRQEIF